MSTKKIIWLAVNSNGDEVLSSNPDGFQRFSPSLYHNEYDLSVHTEHLAERKKCISFDDTQMKHDHWIEYYNPDTISKFGTFPTWNYLPKGTIKKIIGRELTWDDEPVKIEE